MTKRALFAHCSVPDKRILAGATAGRPDPPPPEG